MAHRHGKRAETLFIGMLFVGALLPRLAAIDRYIDNPSGRSCRYALSRQRFSRSPLA